jgi:hypothetical protein
MPLLVVCAADWGILVPLEDLEDPDLDLPLGFLLFKLDQVPL